MELAPPFDVPTQRCPRCATPLTLASWVSDTPEAEAGTPAAPTPGDYTFCLYCARMLQFTDTLGLRTLSGSEVKRAMVDFPVLRQIARRVVINLIEETVEGWRRGGQHHPPGRA